MDDGLDRLTMNNRCLIAQRELHVISMSERGRAGESERPGVLSERGRARDMLLIYREAD